MDDDELDLIPLHRAETRAPLAVDIHSLKRKTPELGGDGHQFFTGDGGEDIIVDEELFDEEDRLMLQDDMDKDAAAQQSKRLKVQESTQRELVARSALARKQRSKQLLSREEKRLAVVLKNKSLTNGELMARYANDEDTLISISVLSPFQSFVNETLGPEEPRIRCFGCTKGVGLARIAPRSIENLERQIREAIASQDVWTACVNISLNFRDEIMTPSNRDRRKGESEINMWTPRSIYDHLTKHTMEPSFVLFNAIMELRTHLEILNATAYRVPKEIYASGREIELTDYIIDEKRHRQRLETTKMLVQLYNCRPDKMAFSNAHFNTTTTPQYVIQPKLSAKDVSRETSIFSKTDLTAKSTLT